MEIPKEFYIGGLKYNVVFDNEECIKERMFGQMNCHTNKITLSNKSNQGDLPKDLVEQTFIHEAVHGILETMQEHELNGNEKFVNTFSTFLHQLIKQL